MLYTSAYWTPLLFATIVHLGTGRDSAFYAWTNPHCTVYLLLAGLQTNRTDPCLYLITRVILIFSNGRVNSPRYQTASHSRNTSASCVRVVSQVFEAYPLQNGSHRGAVNIAGPLHEMCAWHRKLTAAGPVVQHCRCCKELWTDRRVRTTNIPWTMTYIYRIRTSRECGANVSRKTFSMTVIIWLRRTTENQG